MEYPVIVRTEEIDGYVAQPIGLPELRVTAASEAEAVAGVRQALDEWLASAKLVHVSVGVEGSGNPWLDAFGRSAADPDFDAYQEELRRARRAVKAPWSISSSFTDHVSLHERGHPPLRARFGAVSPESIAVSVVTVEEALRGRLAVLARQSTGEARERAYAKLMETVRFFSSVQVVLFDIRCEQQFQALRSQRVRVGTQDLRIAATALAHDLTLVTRNRRDFARVPGLVVEDWS
jgi:tRNA(fMet)-specific endonuclease VapC